LRNLSQEDVVGVGDDAALEPGVLDEIDVPGRTVKTVDLDVLEAGIREPFGDSIVARERVEPERATGPALEDRLVEDHEFEQTIVRNDRSDRDFAGRLDHGLHPISGLTGRFGACIAGPEWSSC